MLENPKIIKITSSPQTPKEPGSFPKLVTLATPEHTVASVSSTRVVLIRAQLTPTQKMPHRSNDTLEMYQNLKVTLLGTCLCKNS